MTDVRTTKLDPFANRFTTQELHKDLKNFSNCRIRKDRESETGIELVMIMFKI